MTSRPTTCRLSTDHERAAAARVGARHGLERDEFLAAIERDPDAAAGRVGLPSGVRLYSAISDEMSGRRAG